MPGNAAAITAFLNATGWGDALHSPLAGDASHRRYVRLSRGADTAVLMIAAAGIGENVGAFVTIARHLRNAGFAAPRILAGDENAGLLLLEDLGDALFARVVEEVPTLERALCEAAVDMLAALHERPVPSGLERMTPRGLAEATEPLAIWYAGTGTGVPDDILTGLVEDALKHVTDLDTVLVLRDFHAENLVWLPAREGHARIGLLDFQDALAGHRAYDLVSLLTDARRDLAPGLGAAMTARYLGATGVDPQAFTFAATIIGLQRNLRILGVFARLSLERGKPGYLRFLPRVWGHVSAGLEHPDLSALGRHIHATIPPPDPGHLARLAPE